MMSFGKPDVRESEAGTCAGRARAAVQDAARRRPLSWAYARQEPSLANGLEPCLIALLAPLSEANHFSLTSLCKVAAPTGPSRGGYSTGFSNCYWAAVVTNIDARASNLPVQTQTLVLATSGWSEISSLYANP